jgi:hypothetical protein
MESICSPVTEIRVVNGVHFELAAKRIEQSMNKYLHSE